MTQAIEEKTKQIGDYDAALTSICPCNGGLRDYAFSFYEGVNIATESPHPYKVLKILVENDEKLIDVDREDLTSILSGSTSSPVSAMTGIPKQMNDTTTATLKDSIKTSDALIKAKTHTRSSRIWSRRQRPSRRLSL